MWCLGISVWVFNVKKKKFKCLFRRVLVFLKFYLIEVLVKKYYCCDYGIMKFVEFILKLIYDNYFENV